MTVSRKGKRGSRRVKMRPASRNKRVQINANLAVLPRHQDDRPVANPRTKEEWVIQCVIDAVGSKSWKGFVAADDVASDIILDLLNCGGFNWEEDEIKAFCRKRASFMVLNYLGRKEKGECEFKTDREDGSEFNIMEYFQAIAKWYQKPDQETVCEASRAQSLLNALPNKHREALEILCGGGNPIDVAVELGIQPWEAITLIREGRNYIHRVDPADEKW